MMPSARSFPPQDAAPARAERLAERLAVRGLCAAARTYLRHSPVGAGKLALWNRVVRPYLAWRDLPIEARAAFGGRFQGALPDIIHTYLYFFGQWEPVITRHLHASLRPGDVVIDVGANVGAHTLLAAHLVGPTGRVHAIEASPSIFASLSGNVAFNRLTNVVLHHMAAADAPGRLTVYLNEEYNRGGTTVMAAEAEHMATRVEAHVACDRLDAIVPIADLKAARLIKIDVEGAEWLVLQGLRDALPHLSPRVEILFELNAEALARAGGSVAEVLALFAAAGFEAWQVPNGYDVAFYVGAATAPLTRYAGEPFVLADFIFRRPAGPAV